MRHFPAVALIWLVSLLLGLMPLAGMAIEVTSAPRLEISEQVFWCASDPGMSISEVVAGNCTFRLAAMADLAHGFSAEAFWLRLDLHNPETSEIKRWLSVGHPRLQRVSLYEADDAGTWHRTDTGINVPLALRPVVAANPVLPLELKAGENRTVYVRVASQTSIDMTLTLWVPNAYTAARSRIEIIQSLIIGGLATIAFLTMIIYLKWRDLTYLYFSASLLFEIVLDTSYTGLLPVYFWPAELSFDIRLQAIAGTCMMISFVLFVRQFIGNMQRYRYHDRVLLTLTAVMVLPVMWACLINYGEAVRQIALSMAIVLLSGVALLFRSWRDGSRPAGYLFASYALLMLMLLYRVFLAFGGSNDIGAQSTGISWRFLLITPIILAGISQRSQVLRDVTRQAAARVQFLAQMSHEIRTPLNSMLGYAELLERNSKRITVQEAASAIKRSGLYLLGMIDEILDHARGEAGKLTLTLAAVRWADFIDALEQSTAMMMRPRGNRFQLTQEGCMPEAVMIDERRFRQVLDILLSNANHYTRHGVITLTCAATPVYEHRSLLTFSVSDTGAGIAPEEQETIFQPFIRGSVGKASGIDGTGIGLAIARQLVTLMDGKIGVKSQPGAGSRFYFSIECELAEVQPQQMVKAGLGKLRQPYTVLVIDDDPNSCNLLAMLLSDFGFIVIKAETGNAARQFLGNKVDLVITDQFMPDGDGWSVLQGWEARDVPVILLSAAPPQRPKNFPSALNFARIQLKPFNTDALLAAISEIFLLEWQATEEEPPQLDAIRPPMELLAPLLGMIEDGAVTDIAEWLESFAHQHPEYSAYGAKIAMCNLALDFVNLKKLIGAEIPLNLAAVSLKRSL